MPSSKSSVDNRDVYYRLGKSAGYRARSAYKLLHLDEEFDLFTGVKTAVDLCAAPGSWSQVLGNAVKPGKAEGDNKVVSLDLQPMAPLPNITILQTDITLPSTIPLVLNALGGRKADLVVCDGAPDVTGVHDLDAYLHSQLLLAALTLSLTLLAPGATLIFKIFLSPLDPQAAMLRSQLLPFFPSTNHSRAYEEFDEPDEAEEAEVPSGQSSHTGHIPKEGGVWVRKPRSSRKGSGEAFIVCRQFDATKVPLPITFPPEALANLARQTTGTLTLDSLIHLAAGVEPSKEWEAIKAYVGSGDLDAAPGSSRFKAPSSPSRSVKPEMTLSIDIESVSRRSSTHSIRALHPQPTPCDEPDEYFGQNDRGNFLAPHRVAEGSRRRGSSFTIDAAAARQASGDSLSTPTSSTSPMSALIDRPWERNPTPLPTPRKRGSGDRLLSPAEWEIAGTTPREDGAVSPALSSGSKTDLFFASSQSEMLPTPPKPPKAPYRLPDIGRGLPSGVKGHDRTVSLPSRIPENQLEVLQSPKPVELIRRGFPSDLMPGSPRIVSNDIPSSPLSTLPTFPNVSSVPPPRPLHARRESQQLFREQREGPADAATLRAGDVLQPTKDERQWPAESSTRWKLIKPLGQGAFSAVWSAEEIPSEKRNVAAVKLTSRATCSTNSRTRIAFLREVSVLRHLSHPAIVSFLASFSTSTHHCLVLEQLSGGELFDLLSIEENRDRMMIPGPEDQVGEGFVRRMFGELVRGVGWLHEVGVVHRDIKLENILLTVNPFKLPPTSSRSIPLDQLPTPLVKLTDFGLSRFINPASPLLQTRCGSESFAAPEIIMGKTYDGRETDAWAMGVVLFALVVGELPFDGPDEGRGEREERKRKMMRIAKGQYSWPEGVGSEEVRRITARLLVRDPKKRSKVRELWKEDWMRGPGEVRPPHEGRSSQVDGLVADGSKPSGLSGGPRKRILDGFLLDEEVEDEASAEAI